MKRGTFNNTNENKGKIERALFIYIYIHITKKKEIKVVFMLWFVIQSISEAALRDIWFYLNHTHIEKAFFRNVEPYKNIFYSLKIVLPSILYLYLDRYIG